MLMHHIIVVATQIVYVVVNHSQDMLLYSDI